MTEKRNNKHLGCSFDAYLVEEGLYEEATSVAWKRVLSWEVSEDATLTSKGQMTIPKLIRDSLGMKTGDYTHYTP